MRAISDHRGSVLSKAVHALQAFNFCLQALLVNRSCGLTAAFALDINIMPEMQLLLLTCNARELFAVTHKSHTSWY